MRLLLDTAVLIFSVEAPDRISRRAAAALSNPENIRTGRCFPYRDRGQDYIRQAEFFSRACTSSTRRHGRAYPALWFWSCFSVVWNAGPPSWPVWSPVIAQALTEGIPVVTPDKTFGAYTGLKLIW